ncbi:MAG: branched-chain amino acid ABC transporter permease [Ardenticatenales bacterium]|nr:branched-chain amino acid ABC transporter permease [Ardenticatenales bacterium]
MADFWRGNRTRLLTLAILTILFVTAIRGMETEDWVITVLRGLSVGAVTFLVASGLSLIFGLMDVLNLAHGELFMIGAYVGWTVYVRPDTFMDVLPLPLMLAVGFLLLPLWAVVVSRWGPAGRARQIWPFIALLLGGAALLFALQRYPITIWNPEDYAQSPISYSLALSQGTLQLPDAIAATTAPLLLLLVLLSGCLLGLALVGFQRRHLEGGRQEKLRRQPLIVAGSVFLVGLLVFLFNDRLGAAVFALPSMWRFLLAMLLATLTGGVLGMLIEGALIRPLYDRPIYQLMMTLGLSFIGIEMVRAVWGRPEFTMPKPELFSGTGDGCPATSFNDLLTYKCSTILLFDGRIRTYNEVFVILVGVLVLVAVWLILQRTRIGMIIRAGVQDSEMVEALGINVRAVFTFVFALGVGLAALGGVLAAPSMGLSTGMGTQLLLLALIALAIGGLTSFPGAAAGAVLVGLLQQFIIKYGQIGINLPFLAEPFKPSPPLVPASTVLLMVIILLVLPNGLFGRKE